MKQSVYFKKYFNLLEANKLSSPLVFQLSFFSNNEVTVFRQMVLDFNKKFNKSILGFYFFSQSSLSSFKDKSSSFNYIFISSNPLATLAFFDSVIRLSIHFSIVSFSTQVNNLLSINFFKAFLGSKFLSNSFFKKLFAERFLFFIKKIEFYNNLRILTFLKRMCQNHHK